MSLIEKGKAYFDDRYAKRHADRFRWLTIQEAINRKPCGVKGELPPATLMIRVFNLEDKDYRTCYNIIERYKEINKLK